MDRFYSPYRDPDEPWFRVGTIDVNTTVLISALSIIVMVLWAVNNSLLNSIVLDDLRQPPLGGWHDQVLHGQLWRLVTWPIANSPSLWTVLDVVVFYLFGRELERALGRTRFLWFLGTITIVLGVVGCLVHVEPGGMFLITTAVGVAFVATYPQAMSFFNIPLWVFWAVFIAIDLLQYTGARAWGLVVLTLLAVAAGLVEARAFGLSDLEWIPKIPLPGSGAQPNRKAKRSKKTRRSGPATVTPINRTPTSADLLRQAEVDILLEKINEHGIKSLTPEERRRLDEHSRRMRDEG